MNNSCKPKRPMTGSVALDKRTGSWMFRWRERVEGKLIRRAIRLDSIKNCRTAEAVRIKWQLYISHILTGVVRPQLNTKQSRWRPSREMLKIYPEMVRSQAGKCAICGRISETLCIDHDHETGKMRELLCGKCNRAIGLLNDSPDLLAAAVSYLRRHGK